MTDQNQKNQDQKKSSVNPVAAVVTGAVVGAGIAVAGTVALQDKKNREKVKQVFSNVKDKTIEYMQDMQKQARNKKEMPSHIVSPIGKGKKKIVSTVKDTKKSKQAK